MTSVGDSSNGLLTEAALNCWLGWNLQLCVNDGVREGVVMPKFHPAWP